MPGPLQHSSEHPDTAVARGLRARRRVVALGILLLLVSALHYLTPTDPALHAVHDVWRRLYYLPIVLGALFFGFRGGLGVALGAAALYFPHVLWQWGGAVHGATSNQVIEIVMFLVMGAIAGWFSEQQRRERQRTERAYQRLQESFDRGKEAEKLAAMGTLSASMAHEIRNPLASLRGTLPILSRDISSDDPRHEFVEIAEREMGRLEDLTSQVLEYARPSEPRWAPDSLNDLVRRVSRLVEKQAQRTGVELDLELDESLPLLSLDSDRMTQVLLNLVLNGVDAMPDGGLLRLRSGQGHDAVWVSVTDDGEGVEPAVRDRLFDAFFTTKPTGTGLGLAVVRQWVQRHGGRIDVESEPGRGSTFTVVLPREGKEASQP